MPHIIYKGMSIEEVKLIEADIIHEVSQMIECPADHFTTEWMHTMFITKGVENSGGYPFVTINWFKRNQSKRDAVAKVITEAVIKLGYSDVCVYFNELKPDHYYENGEHF